MKIKRLLLSALLCCSLSCFAMTDQEVIAYVKSGIAAGKSQQQIGKELLAKGVTPEQAERIKASYEAQEGADKVVTTQNIAAASTDWGSSSVARSRCKSRLMLGSTRLSINRLIKVLCPVRTGPTTPM